MNYELKKDDLNLFERGENFIEYLDVNKLTLNAYRNGINCFLKYLEEKNIKHPTRNDFRGFREELKQSMSINTINSYMTAIRRFFKYLEVNGIYEDITKDIKSLKYSKTPATQILSEELCKEI